MKTDFVTVQYEDRFRPGTYGGREYSYIADHRLKVGDVVYVETKLGAGLARVARIDVAETEIPQIPNSGPARISVIEMQPGGRGLAWLANWLNERYNKASCVVIDGRGGADVLVDRISDTWKVKNSVVRASAKDVVAAAGLLINAVNEGGITWYRPQEALRESAVSATKRPISGGIGLGGENSLPIEACALALWGAKTSRRDPTRKMRIG